MKAGEFPAETISAAPAVAIILTQSWCPQWRFLSFYLKDVESECEGCLDIAVLEYDKEPFFEDFMNFKERHFGNYEVPYIRYYRDGALVAESNFISRQGFLDRLGLGKKEKARTTPTT